MIWSFCYYILFDIELLFIPTWISTCVLLVGTITRGPVQLISSTLYGTHLRTLTSRKYSWLAIGTNGKTRKKCQNKPMIMEKHISSLDWPYQLVHTNTSTLSMEIGPLITMRLSNAINMGHKITILK